MANKLINIDDILRDFIDPDDNDLPDLDRSVAEEERMMDEGGGEEEDVDSTISNIIAGGDNDVRDRIKSEAFEGPVPTSTQQQQRQLSSGNSIFLGRGGYQGVGVGVNLGGIGRAGVPEISPTTNVAEAAAASSGRGRGYGSGGGRGGRGRGGVTGGGTKFSARSGPAIAGVDEDGRQGRRGGGKRPRQGGRNMTEQQRLDRRCTRQFCFCSL